MNTITIRISDLVFIFLLAFVVMRIAPYLSRTDDVLLGIGTMALLNPLLEFWNGLLHRIGRTKVPFLRLTPNGYHWEWRRR